jgi:Mrp family chromosome partitioning ATPase
MHAARHASAQQPLRIGQVLHSALRGRYHWAITLSILFGFLGGAVAWQLGKPKYESRGLLRIAYTRPVVLVETDQNAPLLMFDTYMASQRMLITSRRVIDNAVQDPIWKASGHQPPVDFEKYCSENLAVETKSHSEYIEVAVRDTDPNVAATAVNSIINAYADLYNNQNRTQDSQRLGVLQERQGKVQEQIDQANRNIEVIASEFGTTNLDQFFDSAADRVKKLDGTIGELNVAMAGVPTSQPSSSPAGIPTSGKSGALTPDQIAENDGTMQRYLADESRLEEELSQLQVTLGPAHNLVKQAVLALTQAKARVEIYAQRYRDFHTATAQALSDLGNSRLPVAGKSIDQLRIDLAGLRKMRNEAYAEMVAIGNKSRTIRALADQVDTLKTELTELNKRMEALRTEGAYGDRLTIVNTGDAPLSPVVDPRKKFVPPAALAGMGLPIGIFVLLSFVRRRYHYADEMEPELTHSVPLLGILPDLDGADREQMLAASHSIHQIRVSLRAQSNGRAYLITSASSGEGKTSVSVALGLSFAASRLRTLVIDCDLVGRRLSRGFNATHLTGLNEAIAARTLRNMVRKTESGIYVLTAGNAAASDACGIPADAIRVLLEEARRYFDIVLVDSGPILGSVEAALLAPVVDGVIFTIVQGQRRQVVSSAARRIASLGGNLSGFIFNRAKHKDFEQSLYNSSSKSSESQTAGALVLGSEPPQNPFGPLVQAVFMSLPSQN